MVCCGAVGLGNAQFSSGGGCAGTAQDRACSGRSKRARRGRSFAPPLRREKEAVVLYMSTFRQLYTQVSAIGTLSTSTTKKARTDRDQRAINRYVSRDIVSHALPLVANLSVDVESPTNYSYSRQYLPSIRRTVHLRVRCIPKRATYATICHVPGDRLKVRLVYKE